MKVSYKDSTALFVLEKDIIGDESILFQNEIKKSVANGNKSFCFQIAGVQDMDPPSICALMALKNQMGDVIEIQGEENDMVFDLLLRSF
jgi:hypothetical protein